MLAIGACADDEGLVAGETQPSPQEHAEDFVDEASSLGEGALRGTDTLVAAAVTCAPLMTLSPVAVPHNIGYDSASCGTGTCRTSCPDANANSDWNGPAGHHGIDIFAYRGAPLVAVADGTVVAVGTPSSTSGLRVRLRDACGWEYYYGHLDSARVSVGQVVKAGSVLGLMGNTGTSGVHTHFNVSPNGDYNNDINPFDLLRQASNRDCGGGFYPLQRHHNAFTTEHYYSFSAVTNGAYGFTYEGTEGRLAKTQLAGTVALYALSKAGLGHVYTTSTATVASLVSQGYSNEGALGWAYPPSSALGRPVYSYYNSQVSDWLYTINAIPNGGYGFYYQGVAWRTP
ncbi:MAG TPA: M23 family metallopeptidase [Kofleriaceae bacterium]|nr:M23 family metallopeptidase [Kofleriaceae bacterium]